MPSPPRAAPAKPNNVFDVFFKQQIQILKKPSRNRTMEDIYVLQKSFASIPFFKDLEGIVRTQVCRALMLEQFSANQVIFREGEPGDKFYIIVAGSVGVFIKEVVAQDVEETDAKAGSRVSFNAQRKVRSASPDDEDHFGSHGKRRKSILKIAPLIPEDEEVCDTMSDPGDTIAEESPTEQSTPLAIHRRSRKGSTRPKLDASRFSSAPPGGLSSLAMQRDSLSGDASRMSITQGVVVKRVSLAAEVKKRDSMQGPPSHSAQRALARRRGSALDESSTDSDRRGSTQFGGVPTFRRGSAAQRTSVSGTLDGRRGSAQVGGVSRRESRRGSSAAAVIRRDSRRGSSAGPLLPMDFESELDSEEEDESEEEKEPAPAAPRKPSVTRVSLTTLTTLPFSTSTAATEASLRASLRARGSLDDNVNSWLEKVQQDALLKQMREQEMKMLPQVTAQASQSPDRSLSPESKTARAKPAGISFVSAMKGARKSTFAMPSGLAMPDPFHLPHKSDTKNCLRRPSVMNAERRTSALVVGPTLGALAKVPANGLARRQSAMQAPGAASFDRASLFDRKGSRLQMFSVQENQEAAKSASKDRRTSAPILMDAQTSKQDKLIRRQSSIKIKNQRRQTHTHGDVLSKLDVVNESGSEGGSSSGSSDEDESPLAQRVRSSGARSPRGFNGGGGTSPNDSGSDASSADSMNSRMSEVSECPSMMSYSSKMGRTSNKISRNSSTSSIMSTRSIKSKGAADILLKDGANFRQGSKERQPGGKLSSRNGGAPARGPRGSAHPVQRSRLDSPDSSEDGSSSEDGDSSRGASSEGSGSDGSGSDESDDSSSGGGGSDDHSDHSNKEGAAGTSPGKSESNSSKGSSGGDDFDEDEAKRRAAIFQQALVGSRRVSLWTDDENPSELLSSSVASSRKQSLSYQTVPQPPKGAKNKKSEKGGSRLAKLRRLSHMEKLMPKMMEVAVLRAGAAFGEVALQTDQPRSATVKTKEDCFFATLARDEYKLILQSVFQKQQKERQDFLADLPLLAGLQKSAVMKMSAMLQQRTLHRGECVYDIDMPVLQVYFAREGEFVVRCRRTQGNSDGANEPKEVARTRSSFSMPTKKGDNGWIVKNKDQFVTVALLKPPCVFGLTGYMKGERKYNNKVVVESLTGTVYCLLAKELVSHFPRELRDQLLVSASAESMFYDNRSQVLRELYKPLERRRECRGQRRWQQEVSTSERLKLFRGDMHPNEAWKYRLERRLAAMGKAFEDSEQPTKNKEDALQISSKTPENSETKEQLNVNNASIKACWWIEELVASNKHALDDLCLLPGRKVVPDPRVTRSVSPNRQLSPEPGNTRSVSPDRRVAPDPKFTESATTDRSENRDQKLPVNADAQADAALSHDRSSAQEPAVEDARLALAFSRQVFHSPSPDALGIHSVARRSPVPPKGKWHPAELAFEDNSFRPANKAKKYGSAKWLAKKKKQPKASSCADPSEQKDAEDLPERRCDGTPSTAAPSSPLRDFSPVRQTSPLSRTFTPATPECDLTPKGRHPHDSKFSGSPQHSMPARPQTSQGGEVGPFVTLAGTYVGSQQENLPARPQTSQGGAVGNWSAMKPGKYDGSQQENLPARPQTSQGGAVGHSTAWSMQAESQKPPFEDLEAKVAQWKHQARSGSATPVKTLTQLGFFADHLVQPATAADAEGKGSPVRSALSGRSPGRAPGGSNADRGLPVDDLQRVYNRPSAGASNRACAVEASPIFDWQRSRTPRPTRFYKSWETKA